MCPDRTRCHVKEDVSMPNNAIVPRLALGAALAVGVAGAAAGTAGAAPAPAPKAKGTTTTYTLHVAALPVTNLCNADAVILNGDLQIRETTTPARNGGYTVQSTTNGRDLTGSGLPSGLDYQGQDVEQSNAYYAPPPYPSTFTDAHYTKLVPQGNAPTEYLVVVLRETVLADGTVVPTINGTYLYCSQPPTSVSHA
jgi:hypothetical protein